MLFAILTTLKESIGQARPKPTESHFLTKTKGLVNLMFVVFEDNKLPFGAATSCNERRGVIHDFFPSRMNAMEVVCVLKAVDTKLGVGNERCDLSPPSRCPRASVGVNP